MRLRPDVAIVPECANPQVVSAKAPDFNPTSSAWCGENINKGLAVFSFGQYRLSQAHDHDESLKYVLPVEVGGPTQFNVLATWAFMGQVHMKDRHDRGPLLGATHRYSELLGAGRTIMAGDFNHNVKWDKPRNPRNFATYVERMDALGLASAYHVLHDHPLGHESVHTIYWRDRKEDSKSNYHIDYIFAPKPWLASDTRCEVGSYADWCGNRLSDHVPMVLEVH